MNKRVVIKQQDVPDVSSATHEMCTCDSYPAWRALCLLLGYTLHTHQEASDDNTVYRDAKDAFGRISGTFVMFRDPQAQNAGHVLIPVDLSTPVTGNDIARSKQSDLHTIDDLETQRGHGLRYVNECRDMLVDAMDAHRKGIHHVVSDHLERIHHRILQAAHSLRRK